MQFPQIEGKPNWQSLVPKGESDPLADPIRPRYSGQEVLPTFVEEDSPGLLQYWQILRQHQGAILLFAAAGLIAAIVVALPQTRIYQARTSIELQGFNENFLNMKSVDPTSSLPDYSPEGYIHTQVKILQSDALMRRVVAKLMSETSAASVPPSSGLQTLRERLHLAPAKAPSRSEAIEAVAQSLQVRSADNTHIVEIFTDSPDPELAAKFANTLVKEYIEHTLESRWKTTQYTGNWLRAQMEDLKGKLERSETELQSYAAGVGLQITQEKTSVAEEKLRELQQELLKAQADRVIRQSKYEAALSKPAESLGEVLDDPMLREQQVRLMDLKRQLAELSSTMQPTHYKVERAQAQIAEVQQAFDSRRQAVISRIHNDYESAARREKLLSDDYVQQTATVTEQAQRRIRYDILKREVDTNRQLYEALLQRVKEAGISAAMRASNISVVDQAFPPAVPYKPNIVKSAGIGLLGGLILGIAFAFIRERADRTIQLPGEVFQYLNVIEHAVIPSGDIEAIGRRMARIPGSSNTPNERMELVTWQRRHSLMTESFRSAVASILFLTRKTAEPLVIVFTSASPSEGKTLVTTNMGPAMAETHRRVLLIDADLRKPRVHTILMLDNETGLSDLLELATPLSECAVMAAIRPTQVKGLDVLTSGPGSADLSNLLYSSRVAELFEIVRRNYDVVLVDTPPMMHMPDARILARYANGVMLVVRAGTTTRDTAMLVKQRFDNDGTPVIGAILNHWNASSRSGYGYQSYYKGYYGYHSENGGSGNGSYSNGNGNGNAARA